MALGTYREKRDFARTPEPRGRRRRSGKELAFVIHKHAARRLHYDVRLEHGGVLMSWAVPKGPPLKVGERRLAVRTEDHPLEYVSFAGRIPAGQYGAGTMEIWDRGVWRPEEDPQEALARGKLTFELAGERLRGRWSLVQMSAARSRDGRDWLMLKRSGAALPKPVARASAGKPARASGGKPARATPGKPARRGSAKAELSPGDLAGARRAALPRSLAPQLCKLAARAPDGAGWLHEIKLDGYRLMCFKQAGKVRLLTRRGEDWSARFASVARALAQLSVDAAVLDGEVVVLDARGISDFQRLQNALKTGGPDPVLFAFDLVHCGGYDLSGCTLVDRKRLLRELLSALPEDGAVRFNDHVEASGPLFLAHACELGLEGAISKRAEGQYLAGRRAGWIKTKCLRRQEFVIGGWSEPAGSRKHLGALLLGIHDEAGALRYAGKVGTGFTQASLRELSQRLKPLARKTAPFANPPRGADARGAHWVEPESVAEIAFTEWTSDGRLRHPTFKGLREDKEAAQVSRERIQPSEQNGAAAAGRPRARRGAGANGDAQGAEVAGVRLSHPERVVFPDMGVTKRELAEYYAAVAEELLPHVADRPLTLVRCPGGQGQSCFYQKHRTDDLPDAVRGIPVPEKGTTRLYVGIREVTGLIELIQRGVLELHPWGARADQLERPDRLVLDLDPGPGVEWKRVVAAAHALRELASELGLASFARTTGGKGLHVVLPIARRSTWDEAKDFTRALGAALARRDPQAFVLVASKAQRKGRIYVDYLRNGRGATAVASFSARARPGAPVATPLAWDEVTPRLDVARFNVRTVPARLGKLGADPWEGFLAVRQALTRRVLEAVAEL